MLKSKLQIRQNTSSFVNSSVSLEHIRVHLTNKFWTTDWLHLISLSKSINITTKSNFHTRNRNETHKTNNHGAVCTTHRRCRANDTRSTRSTLKRLEIASISYSRPSITTTRRLSSLSIEPAFNLRLLTKTPGKI